MSPSTVTPLPGTDPVAPSPRDDAARDRDIVPAPMQPADPLHGAVPAAIAPPPPPGIPDASLPMQAVDGITSPPPDMPASGAPMPGAPGIAACAAAPPGSPAAAQCAAAGLKAAQAVDAFVALAREKRAAPADFAGTPMGNALQALRGLGPPPVPPVMRPRTPGAAPVMNLAPGGHGTALSHRPIFGGMSAMQGKPVLPGMRGPSGLFGKPGMSVAPAGSQGIGMASPAHKVAAPVIIRNHEEAAAEKHAMNDWYACGGGEGRDPDPGCMARAGRMKDARRASREAAASVIIRNHEKGAAGAPSAGKDPADAGKAGQQQAHYGPAVSAARSCGVCANFDGRSRCAVVAGQVDPTGTSDFFAPRPEMAQLPRAPVELPDDLPQGTKLGSRGVGPPTKSAGPIGPALALTGLGATLGGGALGATRAPAGHKTEGFARGAHRARLGTVGALGGGLLAAGLGRGLVSDADVLTALALAGAGAGGYAGNALAGWSLGKPSWHRKDKPYHPSGLAHPRRARAALAAGPLALGGAGVGVGLYGRHLLGPVSGAPDSTDVQSLVDRVAGRGRVRVVETPLVGHNAGYVHPEDLDELADALGPDTPAGKAVASAPAGGVVLWNPAAGLGRGAMAHEGGHAAVHAAHPWLSDAAQHLGAASMPISGLSTLASPLIPDRKWARRTALLGSALQLPRLLDEVVASHHGGMGLAAGHHGLEGLGEYLRAYAGVPTYALSAAAPLLAYGGARLLGRWGRGDAHPAHDGRAGRDADSDGRTGEGRRKAAAVRRDDEEPRVVRPRRLKPWMPAKGRSRRRPGAATKCACAGGVPCGPCAAAARARKPYKEVRPERREGDARFAWRGRGARNVTDDPGYEKYLRKRAALAALDALNYA